jgi:hypothetical protein
MRCVLCLALLLAACGGSSSETPPPLEPDPTAYRYTGPRLPGADEPVVGAPEPEAVEEDEDDLPKRKKAAVSTWGSGKPAPRATPSGSPLAPQPSAVPPPPASAAPQPVSPATPAK